MTNIRKGDEFILILPWQNIIILLERLRQAIEYSGRLRAFVVGGENLELCEQLELMWQKAESNRSEYKPLLSQINSDLEQFKIEQKAPSNGQNKYSGLAIEKNEKILYFAKHSKAYVAITRIVIPEVEASLLVLGSQLNVWIKLERFANQNNGREGISWGYAGSPNGNGQNAIEPEAPFRVSLVVEPEAIAQLLATPAVAAAIPHCSSLEAADLQNDPNLLGRFWRQFQQIVPPDWEEHPSREVGDRQSGMRENLPNPSSQKSLADSVETHLFSEAPIGIIYQSLDGGILAANPAFCRMIGYTKEQLRHLDLRSISHPEDFAVEVRLIESLLEEGLKRQSLRKRYLRRNGSILATEISMSLVGEESEEGYLMTFVKDLSDRALAERELEQQREREGILNEISAQIRSNQALPKILQLAVERVQQALNADRVLGYQIRCDRSGICVAEAVDPAYPATEGNVFPVDCIPSAYLDAYRNGRLWRADDVWASDLAQCHREMLSDLDARSIIAVGIRYTNKGSAGEDSIALWGLLVIHHCHAPRRWTKIEEQLVQAVADRIGIAIEQTRLAQQEHSSRANAEYLRSFIEQSNEVFAEYDSELRYLSINSAGALLLQLPPAQIIGKTNRELLGENAADSLESLIRQVFTSGETVRVTNEISFADRTRTFDSVYAPITDAAGRVRRAIGVSKDVTELRDRCQLLQEKNEELTAMNRMKEDFITTTSHELRTPLTAILGFANVLLEGAFGELNSKQFDYTERIHNSGQHLLELINDILDLSRMEADRLEVEPQLVFIHDLCQSTISLIRERVANHGLNLEVEVAPDLEYMLVDYRRLKQMLLNLLGNAIKFTPEGTIGLKIYKTRGDRSSNHSSSRNRHSDWIHFMVWDTGIGIDQREQERLFIPFSQIDSSLSRQYQGSGLGLTITRKLAELLGGYISLESDTNKGSSFTISLPLQEEPEALTGNWQ
ncbi:MAG: PAS domain S-box protein [Oscillatoria sp. SIO1A7]|nr:PAS domain S-box protein [Oscillatoria sp. SIO1A7]